MAFYISNPVVNLRDKFILSFDVTCTSSEELIAIGADSAVKSLSDLRSFITTIDRGVVVDNGTALIPFSKTYATDNVFIWRKDGKNNELLGLDLQIIDGKVYEEVKDISTYNAETDMLSICVRNNKLFKYTPMKYIIDSNGTPKLDFSQADLTSIFSIEKGVVKVEQYHFSDSIQNFSDKLRFIFNNSGSTIDIAKRVDDTYETIQSFFFASTLAQGYIYLSTDRVTCKNLNLNYQKA